MGSSRFPGKPMAKINNKPMIGHVFERVNKCNLLEKTVVATCDEEISEYVKSINGEVVMTSDSHERASDRAAEALVYLENKYNTKYDIIVMVQGDEPMTHPDMIDEAVKPMLQDSSIGIVNLYADIKNDSEFNDRNCIKVVLDRYDDAIYFSREPIPHKKRGSDISMKKQVCIIPFKRDFLFQYQNMSPTPLEVAESIDMMRVLENGYKVRMVHTQHETQAVDTKEDLEKVQLLMSK